MKNYQCTVASEYAENYSLDEIYRLIHNWDLITMRLKNGLEIYQWQDITAKVETRGWRVYMHFWDVYLSDTVNIVDKRNEYWELGFDERIEKCEKIGVKELSNQLKNL